MLKTLILRSFNKATALFKIPAFRIIFLILVIFACFTFFTPAAKAQQYGSPTPGGGYQAVPTPQPSLPAGAPVSPAPSTKETPAASAQAPAEIAQPEATEEEVKPKFTEGEKKVIQSLLDLQQKLSERFTCHDFSDKAKECAPYTCQVGIPTNLNTAMIWTIIGKKDNKCLIATTVPNLVAKNPEKELAVTRTCEYDAAGVRELSQGVSDMRGGNFIYHNLDSGKNCRIKQGKMPKVEIPGSDEEEESNEENKKDEKKLEKVKEQNKPGIVKDKSTLENVKDKSTPENAKDKSKMENTKTENPSEIKNSQTK